VQLAASSRVNPERQVQEGLDRDRVRRALAQRLSPKLLHVLELARAERSPKQIAEVLGVNVRTVYGYLKEVEQEVLRLREELLNE
jgi:DNA-binding CsgD family transcriptional regulator